MNASNPVFTAPIVRYNKPAIFLHWAIFLLVVVAYLAINVRGPKGTDSRALWTGIHLLAGLLVFGLAVIRSGWRLRHSPPPEETSSVWLVALAKAAHMALYAFILLQPILGILLFNLGGHPVAIIGTDWSFTLVDANPTLAPIVKSAHKLIGTIFYYVIGLHALAALWHHYIVRDNTLRRML